VPISNDDAESARLLLEAGADPNLYLDDDGRPLPVVWAAVEAGCGSSLLELMLDHHADPNDGGPDGRTRSRRATARGRTDLVELLRRHGAADDATGVDRFLAACVHGDRTEAERQLDSDPGLLARLEDDERAALVRAAGSGDVQAVELMLDLGFPLESRGDDGGTALHAAAYAGSAATARLLLGRGADVEARDTTWDSTPLGWAAVGSGQQPREDAGADWVATARAS
jgi:ankyrin repeat protein